MSRRFLFAAAFAAPLLAELALARASRSRVLAKFRESQGDDAEATPHAYANKQVWAVLQQRLRPDDSQFDLDAATVDELQRAAVAALTDDSQRREAKPVSR